MDNPSLDVHYIGELQSVALKPGDVLVLRTPQPMSLESFGRNREQVEALFPGHKVLVLFDGMSLGVVTPTSSINATPSTA